MDGWERAYKNLRLAKLDQSPVRFLLYVASLAFWIHVSAWLLLRTELIPRVDDVWGWLALSLMALPGNTRVIFFVALGPSPKIEEETIPESAVQAVQSRPKRRIRLRLRDRWRSTPHSPLNSCHPSEGDDGDPDFLLSPHPAPAANPQTIDDSGTFSPAQTAHPAVLPPPAVTGSTIAGTLVKILIGVTLFTVCGGFWLTGGNFVDPSDKTTEPPRLRNQAEKIHMLKLINQARVRNGVPPVVMGTNNVAQIQADNLLRDCVLSHWGTDGLKPYMRYSLAGGYQTNGENALTSNECGLADTLLQWNDDPMKMVSDAVGGWLDSPGHRETMLSSSYRKVNIGLAWDRNTFKAIQHFEGDYVAMTLLPAIEDGRLSLEGILDARYEFDGRYPLVAFIIYDPGPMTLTTEQLLLTSCYSPGDTIAAVIPPSPLFRDNYEYTETLEGPHCIDPYEAGEISERPETRREMERAWTSRREKSETIKEKELSVRVTKAEDLVVEGRKFWLSADLGDLLLEFGPGVYTVFLAAELVGLAGGDELEVISEFSIFHEVAAPASYSGHR